MAGRESSLEKYQILLDQLYRERDRVPREELEGLAHAATTSPAVEGYLTALPDGSYPKAALVALVNGRIRGEGREKDVGLLTA